MTVAMLEQAGFCHASSAPILWQNTLYSEALLLSLEHGCCALHIIAVCTAVEAPGVALAACVETTCFLPMQNFESIALNSWRSSHYDRVGFSLLPIVPDSEVGHCC